VEIFDLLHHMRKIEASDLHLSPYSPPLYRVDGEMFPTTLEVLRPEDVHLFIYDVMSDAQRLRYEEEWEIDFSVEFKGLGRYRVNVFRSYYGDAVAFRAVYDRVFTFEDLGLPEVLKTLAFQDQGLILITGPTGSGKTTTLATVVDYINSNLRKHIISIEDPVEYIHTRNKSLISHREVGTNTHSFAKALRSSLREDPDVIIVGEMRDLETTALAMTAAETGHLVFGTLHTVSATHTIDRIIDQFPAEQQNQIRLMASESILGVISQRLLKKKGGGRVAAFEVMLGIPAVANLIREEKSFQLGSIIQTNTKIGMITMSQSMENLVNKGVVEKKEAFRAEADRDILKDNLSTNQ